MNSNAMELEQQYAREENLKSIREHSNEDDSPKRNSQDAFQPSYSLNKQQSDFSAPADEDLEEDESSNRMLRHNSPRQSFKVFNQ